MSSYEQPIEGRTMTLEGNTNTGFSGDSLQTEEGSKPGDWVVYWYYSPTSPTQGGITNIEWPSDFDAYSNSTTSIYTLFEGLPNTQFEISQAVYNYASYYMWEDDWVGFREKFEANNCVSRVS